MDKNILLHTDARKKIILGANKLADTVKVTMGAKGKLVVIEDHNAFYPILSKDGITVADSVFLEDRFENMGAKMVKQATQRALSEVADGTTTATVLAQALINEGANKSPREISETYTKDLQTILKALKKVSKKATDKELRGVALLAANGDKEIGNMIAKAYKQIGRHGAFKVENTTLDETSCNIFEGLNVESQLSSPYFATDTKKMECVLKNPYILCFAQPIQHVDEILNAITFAEKKKKPLLVVAPDIEPIAMHRLILMNQQAMAHVVYLRAPEYGKRSQDIMEDIAFVSGGKVQTIYQEKLNTEFLGSLPEVIIRTTNTSIVHEANLKQRIAELEPLVKLEDGAFVERRIRNLASKLAVIKVGGLTDIEQRERKDRVDDAVGAIQSASREGVVAGAGNTLAYLAQKENVSEEFKEALKAPLMTILENAEIPFSQNCLAWNTGYDVVTGEYKTDLKGAGIIDSSNSLSVALESAVSVANNILNTSGVILSQ